MRALVAALALALAAPAAAQRPLDDVLESVAIAPRLDARVPGELAFRNGAGERVTLGDLRGDRPVVLALVYYECPMLCNLVLAGLVRALRAVRLEPGEDFDVVAVSIDHEETPELAARAKERWLERYGDAAGAGAWHFLVGGEPAVSALADSVGFRYRYDPERDEYAHASAIFVLTPDGRISSALFGVEYAPRDLRLALVEASAGEIGTLADAILLLCYHYDPLTGRYGFVVLSALRVGGGLTVALLLGFVLAQVLRERRRRRADPRPRSEAARSTA